MWRWRWRRIETQPHNMPQQTHLLRLPHPSHARPSIHPATNNLVFIIEIITAMRRRVIVRNTILSRSLKLEVLVSTRVLAPSVLNCFSLMVYLSCPTTSAMMFFPPTPWLARDPHTSVSELSLLHPLRLNSWKRGSRVQHQRMLVCCLANELHSLGMDTKMLRVLGDELRMQAAWHCLCYQYIVYCCIVPRLVQMAHCRDRTLISIG